MGKYITRQDGVNEHNILYSDYKEKVNEGKFIATDGDYMVLWDILHEINDVVVYSYSHDRDVLYYGNVEYVTAAEAYEDDSIDFIDPDALLATIHIVLEDGQSIYQPIQDFMRREINEEQEYIK